MNDNEVHQALRMATAALAAANTAAGIHAQQADQLRRLVEQQERLEATIGAMLPLLQGLMAVMQDVRAATVRGGDAAPPPRS